MQLPDGSILMHAGLPYDPAKAHEYYLRVRKLKGSQNGGVKASPSGSAAKLPVVRKAMPVRTKGLPTVTPRPSTNDHLVKAAEARLTALEGRLSKLRRVLDQIHKENPSTDKSARKAPAKPTAESTRNMTPAQRKKAAADSAEWYRENKDKKAESSSRTPAAKAKMVEEQITQIENKITAARTALKAVVKRSQVQATTSKTTAIRR